MEFSPEPGRNDRIAGSRLTISLGARKSIGFGWHEHSLGDYLWGGRGYLLPGTSIMGQVVKERLQENNKEKREKSTALPEAGMK